MSGQVINKPVGNVVRTNVLIKRKTFSKTQGHRRDSFGKEFVIFQSLILVFSVTERSL